jgi:hypothetical protein
VRPGDADRRLPGWRLRRLAERVCSPVTVEHLVDPIVADLQHEWREASERSPLARATARVRGYAAFTRALTFHLVLAAGGHLARNAFGATPEERAFHQRAGVGTLGALAASTSIVALCGMVMMVRSVVFAFTHLRGPGAPTVADVLPGAIAIATNPRGLLLLLPSLIIGTLPPSLLFGILHGVRPAGNTRPTLLPPFLRGVAGISLAVTLLMITLTGWVAPALGQRYREFLFASIVSTAVYPGRPAKEARELSLSELGARADAEEAAGRGDSSRSYRVEWHRRLAWAAAAIVFGLVGAGLSAQRRVWTTRQIAAMTLAATVLYYCALSYVSYVSARALDVATSSTFLVVWSVDIAIGLVGAALLLRAYGYGRSPLAGDSPFQNGWR